VRQAKKNAIYKITNIDNYECYRLKKWIAKRLCLTWLGILLLFKCYPSKLKKKITCRWLPTEN